MKDLVSTELLRARNSHRGIVSMHEGYAVIKEEFDEFWEEVKTKHPDREKVLEELTQVAAMCQRFAEDLELV